MIIGTAGHVDHGKTELIRAITGIDTDRLNEEKERRISIDLGFAFFRLPSGQVAGVVDVPGHEKFIHNMLAGIGGIDLFILVVDAAEGVMPQTTEHLEILELLQIKTGLVVITKIDLVDEELLELVQEDVRESLEGTFLEDAPVHMVSSYTGEGIKELVEDIDRIAQASPPKNSDAPLRIPVDRAFSIAGFGTVLTGTLISGTVRTGETVELLPPGKHYRVRSLQVHGKTTDKAFAGQRVALNLPGLDKDEVERGAVIADPGYFQLTRVLDAKLTLLPSASRSLYNMAPVHFYQGTSKVVAKMLLLGANEIKPGEQGYVQCRLDRPVVLQRGDRFIIRSYSPMLTIGGGFVLDESPRRHKRFRKEVIDSLKELESEDSSFILHKLSEVNFSTLQDLSQVTKISQSKMQDIMHKALERGEVISLNDYYAPARVVKYCEEVLLKELERFHEQEPLVQGIQKAHLAGTLPYKVPSRAYDALLQRLKDKGNINISGDIVYKEGFSPHPTKKQQEKIDKLLENLKEGGVTPPSVKNLLLSLDLKEQEGVKYLEYLMLKGEVVKVTEEIYLHREAYERCLEVLREYFQEHDTITLAQYRDLLQGSRRHAQAILEHFDSCKYTRRTGDERVPWKLFKKSLDKQE